MFKGRLGRYHGYRFSPKECHEYGAQSDPDRVWRIDDEVAQHRSCIEIARIQVMTRLSRGGYGDIDKLIAGKERNKGREKEEGCDESAEPLVGSKESALTLAVLGIYGKIGN